MSWFDYGKDILAAFAGLTRHRIELLEKQCADYKERAADMEAKLRDCQNSHEQEKRRREQSDEERVRLEAAIAGFSETVLVGGQLRFVASDDHPRFPTCSVCYPSNHLIRLFRTPDKPAQDTGLGMMSMPVTGNLSCPNGCKPIKMSDAEFSALQAQAEAQLRRSN